MFHSQLALVKEKKEMEKLKRMKINEEERKKRIFSTKKRMIGIDKHELDRQLMEKRMQKELEKAMEDKLHRQQAYAIYEADRLENEILETKKRINQEINHFRKVYQKQKNRHDDQVDDGRYQKEPGISSGLIFDGEDSSAKTRKLLQTQQQKSWLLQQISEKNQIYKEKLFAEKIHGDSLSVREKRAQEMNYLEEECRRQRQIAIKEYNEALARANYFRKRRNYEKEHADNETEIRNAITSDLLTENTEIAQSNLGSGKVIQYHYKGMPETERREIHKMQLEQIKERQVHLINEFTYNQKWDHFYKQMDKLQLMNDEKRKQEEREICRLIMEKNKLLSLDMKVQESQRKKKDDSGFSTNEFLNQFNKTTR